MSLLTALRIWVSLPDELGTEAQPGGPAGLTGGLARRTSQVSPCNCSNRRPEPADTSHYPQDVEVEDSAENILLLPGDLESGASQNTCPPSYSDCLTVLSKPYLEAEDDSALPPTYSSLNLSENISSSPPPPHYEEAVKLSVCRSSSKH